MMREEIEMLMIKEELKKAEKKELQVEEEDEGPSMELEHCYFNFNPMIRKIKIDKFAGRKADEKRSTDYLQYITRPPQEFDNIEDIFLSYLLNR